MAGASSRRRRPRSAGRGARRPRPAARPRAGRAASTAPGAAANSRCSTSASVVELDELLLERLREAAAAEVPAVELLQEAGRPLLAQLAHRLADEEDELGDDLLAARLAARRPAISPSAHGFPCAARPTMTAAQPVSSRSCCAARARGDVARGDHRHVDALHQLGGERVVGGARVHLLAPSAGAASARRRRPRPARADVEASREPSARPRRILTVTGTSTAAATAPTIRQARSGSSSSVAPGAGLRHLADRAAEVDVDDVGAGVLDHARRLGHHVGLGAEDLDGERASRPRPMRR